MQFSHPAFGGWSKPHQILLTILRFIGHVDYQLRNMLSRLSRLYNKFQLGRDTYKVGRSNFFDVAGLKRANLKTNINETSRKISKKKEIIMWMCIKTIRRISELNFTVQQTALSYETNLEKLVDSAGLNKKWIPHWNIAKRNHHHHQQHHHHRKLNGALISELGLLCSYCF